MKLSVVVVNWNSRRDLRRCLRSLQEQSHQDLETIVVDNGSTDGSVEMVATEFSQATLLAQDENLGFAEGCNRGIEASTGEWVCMLNNDTVADPGFADALVSAAENAPARCGMLQCLMLLMSKPNTINSTGIDLRVDGGGVDRGEGEPADRRVMEEEIFCPTAGAAAYRRTMLEAIKLREGYFDRRHFMYFEDMDLGWRARLGGWTARYVPTSKVQHRYHGSSDRHGRSWLQRTARINRMRTLLKNASLPFLLRCGPRSALDLLSIVRTGGYGALRSYREAIAASWSTRAEVEHMTQIDRRAVESRWVTSGRRRVGTPRAA